MIRQLLAAVAALSLAGCMSSDGGGGEAKTAMAGNESHAHMGHVMTGWTDTPSQWGLLPTAQEEAKVAIQHAGLAAQKPGDLAWMKMHTVHVLHALDPSVEANGPGHGYGVVKAATGAAKHIEFAAGAKDASDNVKLHAQHVAASSYNAAERAQAAIGLGRRILASDSPGAAAPLVVELHMLCEQIAVGRDANGDGKITWEKGEGGLDEARKHMGFMTKGEGLDA